MVLPIFYLLITMIFLAGPLLGLFFNSLIMFLAGFSISLSMLFIFRHYLTISPPRTRKGMRSEFKWLMLLNNRMLKSTVAKKLGLSEDELDLKLMDWSNYLPFNVVGDVISLDDSYQYERERKRVRNTGYVIRAMCGGMVIPFCIALALSSDISRTYPVICFVMAIMIICFIDVHFLDKKGYKKVQQEYFSE